MELDDFIKRAVKEAGLESPSLHFTDEVLQKVQVISQKSPTAVYHPLIPKTVWWTLVVAFIGILCYAVLGNGNTKSEWIPNLDFAWFSNWNIWDSIPVISVSDTVIFSAVAIGFLIAMQLVVLKRYMDSRISLG